MSSIYGSAIILLRPDVIILSSIPVIVSLFIGKWCWGTTHPLLKSNKNTGVLCQLQSIIIIACKVSSILGLMDLYTDCDQ